MKANEATEKIYFDKHTAQYNHERRNDDDIEYTRTDAFIEKACEWIKKSITNNPECNRIISKKGVITIGEIVKDFRKYMKGE